MNPAPISTFIVFSKGDEDITERMRPLLDEPIPISDMSELHVCLSERGWLNFSESNLSIFLKKLLQNITNIRKKYLIRVGVNTGNRPVLVPLRTMRHNGARNPSSSRTHLNLKAMRDEWLGIDGDVGHLARFRLGGD